MGNCPNVFDTNQIIPAWLEVFLKKTFFGACSDHKLQKNELNMYCLTIGLHNNHKLLKIYRHVYQDVVPLKAMEEHIDCSNIQPYKCNKKWIVAMNPLPHCNSGAHIDRDLSCFVCQRKLMDPARHRYCCIACKLSSQELVEALTRERKGLDSFFSAIDTLTAESETTIAKENKRKRRRKGIPIRAPLR
ncbi:hypothetical protein M9H77_19953 [Catharanthus roseus]|uniref:Uncharacterized protein n=1 Tax=Catharanthus roseus TaxID=4058 RepID=A0ACC0AJR6_CATRO|nr:hypothetical protein M9H77_19953 [Catharanthus roseus]